MHKNFTFHSHISAVCSSCFYFIRDLQCIHRYLDLDSAKITCSCSCVSIIAIHFRMVSWTSTNLQRVPNQVARVVTKSPPFARSVPLLYSLHWLLMKFRILFKISLLTYKTFHVKQPLYLHSMLDASSIPFTWSNKGISLLVLRIKTSTDARALHSK